MEFHITQHADHVEVEYDGMSVILGRSSLDGALSIDICTSGVEFKDRHPDGDVPRLRLAINDSVEQLDELGNWDQSEPYPAITVLDHLVDAVGPKGE